MSVFATLSRIAEHYRAAQARYLTERHIQALPYEIQKDIGWPDARPRRPQRPLATGLWVGDQ